MSQGPRQLLDPLLSPARRLGRTLRTYDRAQARGDLTAGLTVAVVAVPQAMAYAIIAGVSPVYGVYTLVFQCLIGSVLSAHPLLSLGPTNTQSLLVASIVARLAAPGDEALYLQLVIGLTLIKGVLQMLMAGARLGHLVKYISQSVIVGFTAGAGVLIAVGQVPSFLGFAAPRDPDALPGVVGMIQTMAGQLDQISAPAVGLGALALAVVVLARRISPLAPGPLIAVVATGAAVYLAGWTQRELTLIGELPQALPAPTLPELGLRDVELLLPGALALALLGFIEPYAVGKSLNHQPDGRPNANQELFSQGTTNFLSSFLSCIPGSGSFARSALNEYAGARTALAGIYNAVLAAGIFLLLAPAARYIPMTAIAAILFVVAWGLIDWRFLRRAVRSNRSDALVCLGTFAATLLVPLAYAVFVGIFLNIAVYLRRASQLHIAEMVPTAGGPFVEQPVRDEAGGQPVMFLQVEGDLFFAQADELQDRLGRVADSGVTVVILRLKRTLSVDATVLSVLEQFVEQMQARGGHVLLCGLRPDLLSQLHRFGLVEQIGSENVFEAGYGVFTSAKRALNRARELVDTTIETDPEWAREDEGWAYEI